MKKDAIPRPSDQILFQGSRCSPPKSLQELSERADALAGKSVAQLAEGLGRNTPDDLSRNKGWLGQLVEAALGASAGARAEPDFPELGVELKTLPILSGLRPAESTFVCVVQLDQMPDVEWRDSLVRRKLAKVLWLPVEADKQIALGARRFGSAFLWSPSARQEAILRNDWEELAAQVATNGTESVTAHMGHWLQVRPKAANARIQKLAISEAGVSYATNPRGFYLRSTLTRHLLEQHYGAPTEPWLR